MTATKFEPASNGLHCMLAAHSRIKLVGLGGVGCIVLEYLALFLHSLRIPLRLVLIDGDKFEPTNAARMRFHQLANKAAAKAAEIAETLPDSNLAIMPVPEFLTDENIDRLIRNGDYVFVCVDNHQTRRLVAEHCGEQADVAVFSGGNDGIEPPHRRGTYGNAQVYLRRNSRDLTYSLTRFHHEIAAATGPPPVGPHCGQLALSTPQILFANLAVASHLLNAFFAYTCGRLTYQEVGFDILEARSNPMLKLDPPPTPPTNGGG